MCIPIYFPVNITIQWSKKLTLVYLQTCIFLVSLSIHPFVRQVVCAGWATSHYLNQCWPIYLPPYGFIGLQWFYIKIEYIQDKGIMVPTRYFITNMIKRFTDSSCIHYTSWWFLNTHSEANLWSIYLLGTEYKWLRKWNPCPKSI